MTWRDWKHGLLADSAIRARWATQFWHTLGTFGHPFHVLFACLWCVVCVGPASTVETMWVPLVVAVVLRLPFVWRAWGDAVVQPPLFLALAFAGWGVLSTRWSDAPAMAWHEILNIRWMLAAWALWGVMDRRKWFIACICVGLMAGVLAQCAEYVGLRNGVELFSHPVAPDALARVSGWWHQPALGGAMLVGALGMFIGPTVFGTGWRRSTGFAGCGVCAIGMVLSGSRGAMLAGSLLVSLTVLLSVALDIRAKRWGRLWKVVGVSAGIKVAIVALMFALPAAAKLRTRMETGVSQVTSAIGIGEGTKINYDSDMGARIVAARAALAAAGEHPLRGAGAGGFDSAALRYAKENNIPIGEWRVRKLRSAHNVYLHSLATLGIVGLALVLGALATGLWGAAWEWRNIGERTLGWYASSPLFALLGLAIIGNFETLQVNMSSAAFVTMLLALCGWVRVDKE